MFLIQFARCLVVATNGTKGAGSTKIDIAVVDLALRGEPVHWDGLLGKYVSPG
jgi:hypothetical protein